ncbi:MAG: hypothetical protein ACKVU1_14620 [bacterium]
MDSYHTFLAAEPGPDAGLDAVRGTLDAHIRRQAARWIPDARPTRLPWWRAILRPAQLATAGVVALTAVWWVARTPEEPILRGDPTPPAHALILHEARVHADGTLQFSWSAVRGADHYDVRLYGPDLHEIYRSSGVIDTVLVVPVGYLPAGISRPLDLTWEIHALQSTDLISVSPPGSIHLP